MTAMTTGLSFNVACVSSVVGVLCSTPCDVRSVIVVPGANAVIPSRRHNDSPVCGDTASIQISSVLAERITATIASPHQTGCPNNRLALPFASGGRNHHNGLPSLPAAATSTAAFGVNGPGPDELSGC